MELHHTTSDHGIPVHEATPEEGRELFDSQSRDLLGISGDEFFQRWKSGQYRDCDENPLAWSVSMMIPFYVNAIDVRTKL